MTASDQTMLTGGRTAGAVVRIGETVRRAPLANSEFVRLLLRHLESTGFHGAPRHLGVDECGREVFSYLHGTVPSDLGNYDDRSLREAARLIRAYHDATSALVQTPSAKRAGIEVVCHNDLSPCNTIFRANGRPVAFIDFDAAAPGTRAYDLGYAVWLWLDLGSPDRSGEEQMRRLRLFLSAYGSKPGEAEVVRAVLVRQTVLISEAARLGKAEMGIWAEQCRRWTIQNLPSTPADARTINPRLLLRRSRRGGVRVRADC